MTDRTGKVVRLRPETCNRLEIIRTHRRETVDDLITKVLDELDEVRKDEG